MKNLPERRKNVRRKEESLRESEEKYRTILESIEEGYYEVDLSGNYTFFNDSLCRILGSSREEVAGRNYRQYVDKENAIRIFKGFNEIYRTGMPTKIVDYEITRKDGRKRYMETSASLMRDLSGKGIGFKGVVRDVTEHKKSKEALRKSEEKYRMLLDNASDAILLANDEGNLLEVNKKAEELLGYKRDELLGVNFVRIHPPEEMDKVKSTFLKIKEDGSGGLNDTVILRKDGKKVFVDINGKVIEYSGQKVLQAIFRDITERKRSEETLEKEHEQLLSLFENIDDAIYVTDMDTYEILYVNKFIKEAFGKELLGKKCFNVFQGLDKPCSFCTNDQIRKLSYAPYKWIHHNKITERYYDIIDRIIRWPDGREVRFEFARDITNRKKLEDDLRKSEQRYRDILESIREGYFELDLLGNYTFVNEANCRFLGYTKKEMVGMNSRQHIDEENAKKISQPYRELYRTGKPIETLEVEAIKKNGTKVIYETSVSLIRDDEGKPIGFRGVSRDVTERKRMKDALCQSEEKYRTILESIDDGYYEVDLAGNYTFVNDAEAENLGYTKEKLIGMNNRQYQDEINYKKTYQAFLEIYRTGQPIKALEMEVIRKDGTKRFNEISASLIRDVQGKPVGFRGITRDTTKRKLIEDALRQSEEKYRRILENMEEGYFEIDLVGNFTFVNNAECRNLGYSKEELIGMNNRRYQDEATVRRMYQVFNNIYKTGEPIKIIDIEIIRKDGTKKFNEISASLVRDSKGKKIGFSGVSRDITESKRAGDALKKNSEELIKKNKEIEESRKNIQLTLEKLGAAYEELKTSQAKILQQEKMASIGQLAAGVAHEINNPMAFIASNLGTLDKYSRRLKDFIQAQSEEIKSIKATDAIEKLEKKRKELKLDYTINDIDLLVKESSDGLERVQKIVQELNRFSRVDDAEYKDANINECIESSINIVWNELKQKAALHKDYGNLPPTKCYPLKLNQVFLNLLINAIQAIEERGKIKIKTWEKDEAIWITISDTGHGISKENQSKIFEPFFTTKEAGKGTGLGLSISYDIIQRHKGEISFKSEKRKGTTFTIKIPIV